MAIESVRVSRDSLERIQPVVDKVIGYVRTMKWARLTELWNGQPSLGLVDALAEGANIRREGFVTNYQRFLDTLDRDQLDLLQRANLHPGHEFQSEADELFHRRRWELDRAIFRSPGAGRFEKEQIKWD